MPRSVTLTELNEWLHKPEVLAHTWCNPRIEDEMADDFKDAKCPPMGKSTHACKYFEFGIDTRDMTVWNIACVGNYTGSVRDNGEGDETILDQILIDMDKAAKKWMKE